MIGNDIVDLALAKQESNWNRQRFLDKVFTPLEQKHIQHTENPERIVWQFWTMKESCYKIVNRETNIRLFNPLQFECSKNNVFYNDTIYYTKTEFDCNFIYSIAVKESNHFKLITEISDTISLSKHNGIPNWYNPKTNEYYPASVTHHGSFVRKVVLSV